MEKEISILSEIWK